MNSEKPTTFEAYRNNFPPQVQKLLDLVRETIKKAAPHATETISYAMPTFMQDGILVHFAAFTNHIGFYATPTGHASFSEELSKYRQGKGSVQFPFNQPLPLDLISRIVQFRVNENTEKAAKKKSLKTCSNGHKFHKTSDCPVCPVCEQEKKPAAKFMATLAAPARRALENRGITSLAALAACTEQELLGLHGMGKSSIPKLREALAEEGLAFKA